MAKKTDKLTTADDKGEKRSTIGKIGPYTTTKGFIRRTIKSNHVSTIPSKFVCDFDRVIAAVIEKMVSSSNEAMKNEDRKTNRGKLLPKDLYNGIENNDDLALLFSNIRTVNQH